MERVRTEAPLQRLFSTFANGWPGAGILLLRLATSASLLHSAATQCKAAPHFALTVLTAPQVIAAGAGIFLLVGLWTPLAGIATAVVELWISFSIGGDPSMPLLLAALGASLAMIGPGAWSIDARLFGRKRIDATSRASSRPSPR
jgi:putative oxidoreductase